MLPSPTLPLGSLCFILYWAELYMRGSLGSGTRVPAHLRGVYILYD